MDKLALIKELRRDEGVKYVLYYDTVGIPTTGVGHNLKAKPLPTGWRYPLDDAQVDELLSADIDNVLKELDKYVPWWKDVSEKRQRVLANMCFNLGGAGLAGFKNTLGTIKAGKYNEAAAGMLKSKWAKQVKGRAVRLAQMMREG